MRTISATLQLPAGNFQTLVDTFDNADRTTLRQIYNDWISLNTQLNNVNARSVNLPEGLSEPVYCIHSGAYRITNSISGANTSFDAYDPNTNSRIQIKACSVIPDLTSFGPRSVWDELVFMDFYSNGQFNGLVNIYEIPTNLILNHQVNAQQTFAQQQAQGRRPRLSIFNSIIVPNNIQPLVFQL